MSNNSNLEMILPSPEAALMPNEADAVDALLAQSQVCVNDMSHPDRLRHSSASAGASTSSTSNTMHPLALSPTSGSSRLEIKAQLEQRDRQRSANKTRAQQQQEEEKNNSKPQKLSQSSFLSYQERDRTAASSIENPKDRQSDHEQQQSGGAREEHDSDYAHRHSHFLAESKKDNDHLPRARSQEENLQHKQDRIASSSSSNTPPCHLPAELTEHLRKEEEAVIQSTKKIEDFMSFLCDKRIVSDPRNLLNRFRFYEYGKCTKCNSNSSLYTLPNNRSQHCYGCMLSSGLLDSMDNLPKRDPRRHILPSADYKICTIGQFRMIILVVPSTFIQNNEAKPEFDGFVRDQAGLSSSSASAINYEDCDWRKVHAIDRVHFILNSQIYAAYMRRRKNLAFQLVSSQTKIDRTLENGTASEEGEEQLGSFALTTFACLCCFSAKSKCDGLRPCSRCVERNQPSQCKDRQVAITAVATKNIAVAHRPAEQQQQQQHNNKKKDKEDMHKDEQSNKRPKRRSSSSLSGSESAHLLSLRVPEGDPERAECCVCELPFSTLDDPIIVCDGPCLFGYHLNCGGEADDPVPDDDDDDNWLCKLCRVVKQDHTSPPTSYYMESLHAVRQEYTERERQREEDEENEDEDEDKDSPPSPIRNSRDSAFWSSEQDDYILQAMLLNCRKELNNVGKDRHTMYSNLAKRMSRTFGEVRSRWQALVHDYLQVVQVSRDKVKGPIRQHYEAFVRVKTELQPTIGELPDSCLLATHSSATVSGSKRKREGLNKERERDTKATPINGSTSIRPQVQVEPPSSSASSTAETVTLAAAASSSDPDALLFSKCNMEQLVQMRFELDMSDPAERSLAAQVLKEIARRRHNRRTQHEQQQPAAPSAVPERGGLRGFLGRRSP